MRPQTLQGVVVRADNNPNKPSLRLSSPTKDEGEEASRNYKDIEKISSSPLPAPVCSNIPIPHENTLPSPTINHPKLNQKKNTNQESKFLTNES